MLDGEVFLGSSLMSLPILTPQAAGGISLMIGMWSLIHATGLDQATRAARGNVARQTDAASPYSVSLA
jgi:hypothetical protein